MSIEVRIISKSKNGNLMVAVKAGKQGLVGSSPKRSITRHLQRMPDGNYRDADGVHYIMLGIGELVQAAGEVEG